MLDFTKKAFDKFVAQNFSGKYDNLIVTRQHIDGNDTVIAMGDSSLLNSPVVQIMVIKGKDFYTEETDIEVIAELNNGITFDATYNCFKLTSGYVAPQSGEHVVMVLVNPEETTDYKYLFENTYLVSIDYVGCSVGEINGGGTYSNYFRNIDMSNVYDYANDAIDGFSLGEGQNVYMGNHNFVDIMAGSFAGTNIKKLVLPTAVNGDTYVIEPNCYANCTSLVEVVIPEGVTAIGAGAFSGCTNLKYVYIGPHVATIGAKAFNKCANIAEFIVDPNNPYFIGLPGCLLQRQSNQPNIIYYKMIFANHLWWDYQDSMENIFVVEGYTSSGRLVPQQLTLSDVFYNAYPGELLLPQVGMVYEYPNSPSLVPIRQYTLINGDVRTGVMVTSSNISQVESDYGSGMILDNFLMPVYYFITEIGDDACSSDTLITNVNLRDYKSLITIGANAFKGCTNMTTLTLPYRFSLDNGLGSLVMNANIMASAFEGCTSLTGILTYQKYNYGDKAFFGCTSLTSFELGHDSDIRGIGTMSFSNTPNLASMVNNSGLPYSSYGFEIKTGSNCIYADSWRGYLKVVVVGCKNTSFIAVQQGILAIGDYAFYGCTQFTIAGDNVGWFSATAYGHIDVIGNYAFYGCVGIDGNLYISSNIPSIGNSAFYGCTGLTRLVLGVPSVGTKAFAKSGITHLTLEATVTSLADDAFEDCIFNEIVATEGTNSACRTSAANVENSLLKRNASDLSKDTTLIKSGDGKDIVNTTYTSQTKIIREIGKNAFTGVNMNSGSNRTIHIPSSVTKVGANCLSGSKFDGSVSGNNSSVSLKIDEAIDLVPNSFVNNGGSMSLLWLLGARFFKNMIVNTASSRSAHTNHFYDIHSDSTNVILTINEVIPSLSSSTHVVSFSYDNNDKVIMTMFAYLLPGYANLDSVSHIATLSTPLQYCLAQGRQSFNQNEQGIYFDNDIMTSITSSTRWQGYSIPNDLSLCVGGAYVYKNIANLSDGAFSNAKWVSAVICGRRLTANGLFSGCTNLGVIRSQSAISNYGFDYNIFDGEVKKDTFKDCTSFTGIVTAAPDSAYIMPIKFGENAFKNTAIRGSDLDRWGSYFDDGSFEGTNLRNLDMYGANYISSTAFKDVNLATAECHTTTGSYFTGAGLCIIDENCKVVVGSEAFDVNDSNTGCRGVNDYAFYKRQYSNFRVNPAQTMGFTIGKMAFAESNITVYQETSLCQGTIVGEAAFKNCTSLTTLNIGQNGTISKESFSGCINLTSMGFSGDIPEAAYKGCTSLTTAWLVGNVAKDAFSGCTSLTSLTMYYQSSSTKIINPSAFADCPISTITVGNGYSDETVTYRFIDDNIYEMGINKLILGNNNPQKFVDTNTTIIGSYAYAGRGLTGEITIPSSVTMIEDYAFANNPGITRINLPPTLEFIGNHAFDGCTGITYATLPDSCTYIGDSAFKGCALTHGFNCNTVDKDYHVPSSDEGNSIPAVGNRFQASLDLSHCYAYNVVSSNAFAETDITIIKLPRTCERIGSNAFKDCTKLHELHINSSSIRFDEQCLYGCTTLSDIYFHRDCDTIDVNTDWCYLVGSQATSPLQIHIPAAMDTSEFEQSHFHYDLVEGKGFNVITDMRD